jgi:ribosomal protein L29
MKKKDIQDMKTKSPMELERIVGESAERLRALRFDLAAGKVKNVAELHEVRKRIARAKTFIREQMTSSQESNLK